VAVEVVAVAAPFARGRSAEHRHAPTVERGRHVQPPPLTRDGAPYEELILILLAGGVAEEDAAVAGVAHVAAGVVEGARAEGGGADEPREETTAGEFQVEDEAQHGRHPVERAVAAKEGGVGEEAAPGLADGRAANEAPRVVRREAEEDLRDELVG